MKKRIREPKLDRDGAPRQSFGRVLKNNLRIILKSLRLCPGFVIGVILRGVENGFASTVSALFTVSLFNALDEGKGFREILTVIGWMAAWKIFDSLYRRGYYDMFRPIKREKLSLRMHRELFAKASAIDVACYDDPEFYNDFVWAMDEAASRADSVLDDTGALLGRLVGLGTLIGLLTSIDTGVALVLTAASVINVVRHRIGNRLHYKSEKEYKPLTRRRNYLNRVFQLPDYSKEIRISHVTDLLVQDLDETTEKHVAVSVRYGKKWFLLDGLFGNFLNNGIYFGVLLYMFVRLLDGSVLIGAFAAAVTMTWNVRWQMNDMVDRIARFPKHSLFLEKYFGFLAYEPRVKPGAEPVPELETLELRDVSFTYDFSDKPKYEWHGKDWEKPETPEGANALKHVSLTLKRGEKIAIVGYNGAGKTTLIKLLMRLYDPTSGQILLNGRDIREFDTEEYRRNIGTVFQDFVIYAAGLGENVMNGHYDPERDRERAEAALRAAGFGEKLASLDRGLDTVLTREFDKNGTNLSGGEGQKVAIARVFAGDFGLIIMDEPSSALDPVAEYELNQAILRYAADKTVIFISHRLSTTRMADRIYMFAKGELTESGSHDELMARHGKYAEMFDLQAEKYRTGVSV